MKYYSDKTHKLYNTEEALLEDEKAAESSQLRLQELRNLIKEMESKLKALKQERDELEAQENAANFFKFIW